MRIHVALNERVFVHINGLPVRYLLPGRYFVFEPFKKIELVRKNTDDVVVDLRPEQIALVPAEEISVVRLGAHERALVTKKGRPVRWLAEGEHLVWNDRTQIEVIDTSRIEAKPLRDEVKVLVPGADYAETTAPEGTVAVRFVDGVLDMVLAPGRHAAWTTERKVSFVVIDLREKVLHVTGQEVMTRDRVTLRVNVSATYRVRDARRVATVAREPDEILYLAIQLATREVVSTRSLDELLSSREALGSTLGPAVAKRAEEVGLLLIELGVKDLVLPGEMKTILNRVIEAQKEAEANVILRREETAAVRSMANTAKVLAENPVLMRLKELEAYKELAAKVGQVHVVMGEGNMPKLVMPSGGGSDPRT